jgi:hypothetical protein
MSSVFCASDTLPRKASKMSCEGSSASPAPVTIPAVAGEQVTIFWEGATKELLGKGGTGQLDYNPWVHA